jgi:hypothetical protein
MRGGIIFAAFNTYPVHTSSSVDDLYVSSAAAIMGNASLPTQYPPPNAYLWTAG